MLLVEILIGLLLLPAILEGGLVAWIGLALGLLVAGPIGAVVGFVVGVSLRGTFA